MFDRELTCLASPDSTPLPVHSLRPDTAGQTIQTLGPAAAAYATAAGFTAAAGQILLLPNETGLAAALLGLGTDRSPYAHGSLPTALPAGSVCQLLPGDFDMPGAVLGFCLGAYQFTPFKTANPPPRAPSRAPALLAGAEPFPAALAMARATWLVRDLVNTPANALGPAELANVVQTLGQRFGATTALITGPELESSYPALAAVGAGSDRPPLVATFTWTGSAAKPTAQLVSLCGKGVCFDSGGYDLKPSAGMLRMKKDMGGAALMLGLAETIMAADLPVRLEVRIGCVENMVSGRAMRPGDVLETRRGLTVEIGNTDAEGRLVLCDLLAEASDADPDLLIDAATLTGAARVALGPDLPAIFCNDDKLAAHVAAASEATHDPTWRLPLWPGYDAWLSSPVADLNNVASKPGAGATIAALFLQRFVAPGVGWLHVDTYAWNDQTRPGRPEGGEALGLRMLFESVSTLKLLNNREYA